jgi:tRNA threonylcarbamoyladenosine biosynthesis protein TsaE
MAHLGALLADATRAPVIVFLRGGLGAGKTTLAGAYLRGLGHAGAVKSPTYTLVEPYDVAGRAVYHFDLYRLNDPEELEFLGVRDYLQGRGVCLVEWPERGAGLLTPADVDIHLQAADEGRILTLESHSKEGDAMLDRLIANEGLSAGAPVA